MMPYSHDKTSQQWMIGQAKQVQHRFNPNWVIGVNPGSEVKPGAGLVACKLTEESRNQWIIEYM